MRGEKLDEIGTEVEKTTGLLTYSVSTTGDEGKDKESLSLMANLIFYPTFSRLSIVIVPYSQ